MVKTAFSFLFIYYLIMNLILFAMMGIDKSRAKKGKWRIPELTLLMLSVVGGAIGGLIGMRVFHHKSRKWYFHIVFFISVGIHAYLLTALYRAMV